MSDGDEGSPLVRVLAAGAIIAAVLAVRHYRAGAADDPAAVDREVARFRLGNPYSTEACNRACELAARVARVRRPTRG